MGTDTSPQGSQAAEWDSGPGHVVQSLSPHPGVGGQPLPGAGHTVLGISLTSQSCPVYAPCAQSRCTHSFLYLKQYVPHPPCLPTSSSSLRPQRGGRFLLGVSRTGCVVHLPVHTAAKPRLAGQSRSACDPVLPVGVWVETGLPLIVQAQGKHSAGHSRSPQGLENE